jgi:predicted phage baseplate assembly protein
VDVESDTTGGLNRDGTVVVHVPYEASRSVINEVEACWIRCRAIRPRPDQRGYSASPQVGGLSTEIIGGTVPASHGLRLKNILVGRSDGKANQTLRLRNYPLLPREEGETIEVEFKPGEWETWLEVEDFSQSGPNDLHFVCDSASGEIHFGPVLRQPDGTEQQFGRAPRRGSQVRFTSYRVGGGAKGNVGRNTLTVLKSSIPYVSAVTNRRGAYGGADAETLEQAKLRAPSVLRSRTAAITAEDYEAGALRACPDVARAHCLAAGEPNGPHAGTVTLLIIPRVQVNGSAVSDEELSITRRLEDDVRSYLEDRRPLTVELAISPPQYVRVGISATVKAKKGAPPDQVETAVRNAFYHYLHPTAGGPDGDGWPLGRPLNGPELTGELQRAAGVDYVSDLQLRIFDPETQVYQPPTPLVEPNDLGILIAGACSLTVER